MGNAAKVAIVVGALFALLIVALGSWGLDLKESEVCEHLKQQESILPLTGPITQCEQRFLDSLEIEDADTFIFRIRGSAGRAVVYVRSTSSGPDASEEYQGILAVGDGGVEVLVEGERPPTK